MTDQIKFQPGSVVATVGATLIATEAQIIELVNKHIRGDWGDLGDDDKRANEAALKWGDRILSSYQVNGEKLWVETTADRSSTYVMTPGEY